MKSSEELFCAFQEMEWPVLELVLAQLPSILMNKALMLASAMDDIAAVCSRLCALVSSTFYVCLFNNNVMKYMEGCLVERNT